MSSVQEEVDNSDDVGVGETGDGGEVVGHQLHVDRPHLPVPGVHQDVGQEDDPVGRVGDGGSVMAANGGWWYRWGDLLNVWMIRMRLTDL